MRYYDTSFFCDKDNAPIAHIHLTKNEPVWPISLTINGSESEHNKPSVRFYIYSIEDLIKFRNSVMFEVDKVTFAIDNPEEDSSHV